MPAQIREEDRQAMTPQELVDYLFTNSAGQEATHLRLHTCTPTAYDPTYLGGWSKSAVLSKLEEFAAALRSQQDKNPERRGQLLSHSH